MDPELSRKLDGLTAAVHELAYAQAATAALVARTAGIKASPEDFLPDNTRGEASDPLTPLRDVPPGACAEVARAVVEALRCGPQRFDDLRELREVPGVPETQAE